MPASYHIDPARRLVTSRAWGVLTDADLQAHFQQLRADPNFDPTFRQLVDFREVSDVAATAPMIRELARYQPFAPGIPRALVVATVVDYGLARMFELQAELHDANIEVFKDLRAAEQWLGIDE